jgi:hypothetical protein
VCLVFLHANMVTFTTSALKRTVRLVFKLSACT